ncbi:hypothetical protein [Hyphobacterium sp.]|jgi:hypothetical protein|uniref:hypothetical protein n=1 Tax=Hyphobacterium sp. TaxID=2004662 RepID=UPI003BAB5556
MAKYTLRVHKNGKLAGKEAKRDGFVTRVEVDGKQRQIVNVKTQSATFASELQYGVAKSVRAARRRSEAKKPA